jgi:hypothetical protein
MGEPKRGLQLRLAQFSNERGENKMNRKNEKLSKAIREALDNTGERVVHAAIGFVLCEPGDEHVTGIALQEAVYSFIDVDIVHDALAEIHSVKPGSVIKRATLKTKKATNGTGASLVPIAKAKRMIKEIERQIPEARQ